MTDMTEFSDLSDDCLIEVLDRLPAKDLFKIQRGNKRLNRLANVKMQTNIKAIKLIDSERDFSDCSHLGSIKRDQVLVLDLMFKVKYQIMNFEDASRRALFLSVVNKCACVKSIDFDRCDPTFNVLLEVFRRCPELECIKFDYSNLNEDEWRRVFDEIRGHKILHFVKQGWFNVPSEVAVMKMIVAKCNNIKRLESKGHYKNSKVNSDLLSAIKMLPKCCWISLDFERLDDDVVVMEDVIDELEISKVKWSAFDGRRYDRLSSLTLYASETSDGPVRGVDFVGLKKLEQQVADLQNGVDYLLASRFPRLEEYGVNTYGLTEEVFDALFQKMPSVKKLTLHFDILGGNDVGLPQAAIYRLKNLETIVLTIITILQNWQWDDFFHQLKQYIDGISSLKKLIIDTSDNDFIEGQGAEITKRVEQMKEKQNRVEVVLIKGFYIMPK